MKRIESTRTKKAKLLIGSMKSDGGSIKEDRHDIANVFVESYAELYADASRIALDVDNLCDPCTTPVPDIAPAEVRTQLLRMSKGKGPDEEGVIAEIMVQGEKRLKRSLRKYSATFYKVVQKYQLIVNRNKNGPNKNRANKKRPLNKHGPKQNRARVKKRENKL